jgi:NAD(P)-dependent dehydrogenase (short-subunit alcohol dehydrogenase family)
VTDASFPLPYSNADLSGQVALVTGATSGLGHRFAQTLAAAGASVVAAGRRADRLDELCALINGRGHSAAAAVLDVTDHAQIVQAVDTAEQAFGTVTILINNAGIPDAQRATKMSLELVDAVLDTNVRAPFLLSCEVARRLIEAKKPGRIVNISSSGAFSYAGDGAALYSITKAAVNRMTEALSVEWAKFHINVNAIAPGAFSSEMMDGMIERLGGNFAEQYSPRKRLGDPAQLDSTLLYLCAPASEFVTGTVVRVDDGQGAK